MVYDKSNDTISEYLFYTVDIGDLEDKQNKILPLEIYEKLK